MSVLPETDWEGFMKTDLKTKFGIKDGNRISTRKGG